MGVVYKARQIQMDRIVAIKMLSQEMAQDENWVKRFQREAKACSLLQHPNTIRVFDFGATREGRLYMAMEFLDGRSLREVIADESPMDPARVIKVLIQCCASLAEAHGRHIVHRDIKPDNVFLLSMQGSPDFVKLLDFSVAKLLQENDGMRTQAGIVFGTPQYMSPEQGRGLPLDARSDLYALGILAYEMLTGTVPFHHDNPMAVLQMHVQKRVTPLPDRIPALVQQVVYRALEKEPSKRYQSAGEMMQHCQQVFNQLGTQTPPHQPAYQAPPPQYAQQPSVPGIGQPPPMPPAAPPAGNFGPEQHTIIAGGAPRAPGAGPQPPPQNLAAAQTIIAGRPPPGLPPAPQQQRPPPPQHQGQPYHPGPPQMAPPFMGASSAEAQTVIASHDSGPVAQARAAAAGQMPGPPGPSAPGLPGVPPPPGEESGPPKTILLPGTEGVVSVSQQYQALPSQQPQQAPIPTPGGAPSYQSGPVEVEQGPSPLFWALCIAAGLAVGVGAYLLVLLLS